MRKIEDVDFGSFDYTATKGCERIGVKVQIYF